MDRAMNKLNPRFVALLLFLGVTMICIWNKDIASKQYVLAGEGVGLENGLAPCGEVCQYTGTPAMVDNEAFYTQLTKNIHCGNIMKRMSYRNHTIVYPPPKEPPKELYEEFTQFGECRIERPIYNVDFKPGDQPDPNAGRYEQSLIDKIVADTREGKNVNTYEDGGCMMDMMSKYRERVQNKTGIIIGTIFPWLEGMTLANGAHHLTTLEYSPLDFRHPQLETYDPYTYAEKYKRGETESFEFGATFSSLEHSGLGRYGDPLNPYGDMEAMAQIWCMMKPNATLFLGLPGLHKDYSFIQWNSHRIYGPQRLTHITANWRYEDFTKCQDGHIVLVLRKI